MPATLCAGRDLQRLLGACAATSGELGWGRICGGRGEFGGGSQGSSAHKGELQPHSPALFLRLNLPPSLLSSFILILSPPSTLMAPKRRRGSRTEDPAAWPVDKPGLGAKVSPAADQSKMPRSNNPAQPNSLPSTAGEIMRLLPSSQGSVLDG